MTFIAFRYLAIELSSLSVQNRHFHAASTLPCTRLTVLYAKRWDSVALPALKGARLREMSARRTEQLHGSARADAALPASTLSRRRSRPQVRVAPAATAPPGSHRPSQNAVPGTAAAAAPPGPQGRRVVPGTPGTPVATPLRRRGRCRRRTARTTPRSCKWTRFSSCWISRRTRAGRADAPAAQYRRTAPPPGR